jgi:hypothetical protein
VGHAFLSSEMRSRANRRDTHYCCRECCDRLGHERLPFRLEIVPDELSIWRIPRSFAWVLPLGGAWVSFLVYVGLHLVMKVPLNAIVAPCLAFTAITMALALCALWAARHAGSRSGNRKPIVLVIGAYLFLFTLLASYYAAALNLASSRIALQTGTAIVLACQAAAIIIVLRRSGCQISHS